MAGPIAVSVKDIWNVAFMRLGLPTVSATTGTDSASVRASALWPMFKYNFIGDHEWNGCKQTIHSDDLTAESASQVYDVGPPLVQATNDPVHPRWSYAFSLEGIENLIRVLRVLAGRNRGAPKGDYVVEWEIEQRFEDVADGDATNLWLLTQEQTISIEVLLDIPTEIAGGAAKNEAIIGKLLGPKAAYAMGLAFAAELAVVLGRDQETQLVLKQLADRAVLDAKAVDGMQSTGRWFEDTSLIDVRY